MCIVTTPFTHAKHEISSKMGYLLKHQSSKMIAKAVNKLLDNPIRMNAMQQNAYERVKDRQWLKIASKYNEIFHEASLLESGYSNL